MGMEGEGVEREREGRNEGKWRVVRGGREGKERGKERRKMERRKRGREGKEGRGN